MGVFGTTHYLNNLRTNSKFFGYPTFDAKKRRYYIVRAKRKMGLFLGLVDLLVWVGFNYLTNSFHLIKSILYLNSLSTNDPRSVVIYLHLSRLADLVCLSNVVWLLSSVPTSVSEAFLLK